MSVVSSFKNKRNQVHKTLNGPLKGHQTNLSPPLKGRRKDARIDNTTCFIDAEGGRGGGGRRRGGPAAVFDGRGAGGDGRTRDDDDDDDDDDR